MKNNRDIILEKLKAFIVEQTNLDDPATLQAETDLLAAGLLDSLLAVSIVAYCEEEFGCEMDLSELSQESFSSLSSLADLVSRSAKAECGVSERAA